MKNNEINYKFEITLHNLKVGEKEIESKKCQWKQTHKRVNLGGK